MPTILKLKPPPYCISDFDWLTSTYKEYPRIAVAVGTAVFVGTVGGGLEEK
jgi:hypothetical protein